MSVDYTLQLEREYQSLYDSVTVPAAKQAGVDQAVKSILANRARYKAVADRVGAPWQFVAVIHNMECSQNFKQHLHNGDPLTAKTVHVPAGRPATGTAPFSWEDSAVDALQLKKVQLWAKWNVPGVLYKLEEYNGWGYRLHHAKVRTPYLWSCCEHYTAGKYVADGTWSDTAVSQQVGAAVLLKKLAEQGEALPTVKVTWQDLTSPAPEPNLSRPLPEQFREVRYEPKKFSFAAQELQCWLSQQPGVALVADGFAGKGTSDAVRRYTGSGYLPGDPRA